MDDRDVKEEEERAGSLRVRAIPVLRKEKARSADRPCPRIDRKQLTTTTTMAGAIISSAMALSDY